MPIPESLLRSTWGDLDLRVVAGSWPTGVRGEMLISAPVIDERLTYQLFGFGAMARISLQAGTHGAPADRFALRVRTIDTPVWRLHEHARDAFSGGLLGLDSAFGHANMVNTAPLAWGDRLFATWDVGRPVEVDPQRLAFLGEVGSARSWGGDSFGTQRVLPQVFSTAHPIIDPVRNCMWTVKLRLGAAGLEPTVVRYDGSGTEVRTWGLPGAAVSSSMHTISQTEHYLVLADSGNFKADLNEIFGGERTVTVDEQVPVYFVRKEVLDSAPSGTDVPFERAVFGPPTGHYYADWDDSDGVRVLVEHMDLTDLGYRLRGDDVDAHGKRLNPALVGMYQMAMAPQTVSETLFHPGEPTGRVTSSFRDEWTWNLQLSAMDWSLEGRRRPTHHHVVFQGRRPGALAQRVLDIYRDRIDPAAVAGPDQRASLATFTRNGLGVSARYEFPADDDFPSSPIFVPRTGGIAGGGDGWVIVPVLGDSGFRVECFDAADVARGPVATLAGPNRERLPFMLHSVWMERAVPAADVERLSFVDDIDPDAVRALPDDLQSAVASVARDLQPG